MTASNNVVIRTATNTDLEVLVGFQVAMAAESEDKGLNESTLRDGIRFALASTDLALYIVAEVLGEPVGTLMLTWEWSDWRNGRFWWIQSVYVVPEHRRVGVYSAMHRHVLTLASQDPKAAGVRLYVEKDNDGAQATYQQLGMDETHYRLFETEFVRN
ncbi:MAG: GNAT family N-acetyltransferase [Pseudomonadota bacterium]|uniref:N-acetyltransferase domain-containing protein n=1 Tax=marine metagenome TaxID=408172 RepID=A0A381NJ39_9ZZZZ|nr:GNAT family N-acetyltransferase [Pseudomonadota bacterium]MEC8868408.1 GNAT family N-acetyltransferase [Pseudomonadota bacterium]MEC9286337.1 GNAT family N-acetyltransferase [Pseudomonadota bacterium]MEE3184094.1 GNAT family N-acetyltransferase [Pseudomonadota bacterium]|tara:strand:+ start:918 stop:1391 length:474 start_codon:yes stop_codon:yes gene_type:complete